MFRLVVVISMVCLMVLSCEEKDNKAFILCNCYTSLHRAKTEQDVNFWGDSCNKLYVSIIRQLENKPKEISQFKSDYEKCQ